ncbi:hypothetical protein [Janthinobacterium sp. PC23-8]|uniref:hypothetical protein n=1 Tax=Janthinobacterium sp. PC23-8 TaxID=2012679 RepID=UPI000B975D59|nr:hypothetical protein [Janthinobacterium sp. PC23-8]OYO31317.1 hypothetical protein CD932_09435 [Janthinobacterium sp. PC23-8]
MQSASHHRQIALVSYGTQCLRGKLALDDWYRHGIFFGARLQFRQLADNALLADDFTWWLGILKQSGAVRLSLHLLSGFGIASPAVIDYGDYAVVAHFPDRHQIWAVGVERPAWRDHPLVPDVPGIPIFPDATSWGGQIDSYWCVEERSGTLVVPETNWKALAGSIAADLEITMPSSLAPPGPVFLPSEPPASWAKFPLFPSGKVTALAHAILASLYREQAKFGNDTHFKNDSSYYQGLDAQGVAKVDGWGRRLDGWLLEVELRCANEYRQRASSDDGMPLPLPPAAARPARSKDVKAQQQAPGYTDPVATSGSKWLRRIVLLVVCLVLLAFARCMWLAV